MSSGCDNKGLNLGEQPCTLGGLSNLKSPKVWRANGGSRTHWGLGSYCS